MIGLHTAGFLGFLLLGSSAEGIEISTGGGTVNTLLILGAVVLGSGGMTVGYQALFNRNGLRADAANKLADAQQKEHKTWFDEAKQQYDQVKAECASCRKELESAEKDHRVEMSEIRKELDDLKEALLGRADAVDELLTTVVDAKVLSVEKAAEMKSANRAVRTAIYKSRKF